MSTKTRPTGIIRTLPYFGAESASAEADCYILVGGKVRVRANIAEYRDGAQVGEVNCWDGSLRSPKWWAVLTAPVSFPPEPIARRGFQGFRYTDDLW